MKNESTLRISRPEMGISQLHKEAIAAFPFLPEYVELKFYAFGIQLPKSSDASHAPNETETFRYVQRCTSNDIIPYSCVKFALEEFSYSKHKTTPPLILSSEHTLAYERGSIS